MIKEKEISSGQLKNDIKIILVTVGEPTIVPELGGVIRDVTRGTNRS